MSATYQLYRLHKKVITTSFQACARVCVYVLYVRMRVYVSVKVQFDFLPSTGSLIPKLNMWVTEIRVCISTFLLAEELIFGTSKLRFFQGLQCSRVKEALITEYVLNGDFLLFDWREKTNCGIESGSRTFSYIYKNGIF